MLVKVACLCYSGSMDFFQIVFHFKSKLVEMVTKQISSKTKLILFENLFKPRQRRLAVLKYSLRLVS